jgi:hypothetical protein
MVERVSERQGFSKVFSLFELGGMVKAASESFPQKKTHGKGEGFLSIWVVKGEKALIIHRPGYF